MILRHRTQASILIFVLSFMLHAGDTDTRGQLGSRQELPKIGTQVLARLGPLRPSEGRLVGMPFSPLLQPKKAIDYKTLRELLYESEPAPPLSGSEGSRSAAFLKLVENDVDAAIEILAPEAVRRPNDAVIQSELSALYLARSNGREREKPLDSVFALAASTKAVSANPLLLEARFNEALALEKLSLTMIANLAWKRYLDLENSADWIAEARQHQANIISEQDKKREKQEVVFNLENLSSPKIVRQLVLNDPQRIRLYAEEDLLGAWANAKIKSDSSSASRILSILRLIGDDLARISNDYLLHDSVDFIAAHGDKESIVDGHLWFWRAVLSERQDSYEQAGAAYSYAEKRLYSAGSPFWRRARVGRGISEYYYPNYRKAAETLESALYNIDYERYPTLVGRSRWMSGVSYFVMADLPRALWHHLEALRIFEEVSELSCAGFIHFLVANDLEHMGEHDEAWRHRLRSLALLDEQRDSRRVFSILRGAADAAILVGEPLVALRFLDELALRTQEKGLPGVLAETLIQRGTLYCQLGRCDLGLREIEQSRTLLIKVSGQGLRERILTDLLLAEGRIRQKTAPLSAVDLFSKALESYESFGYRVELATFLKERAVAYRSLGLLNAAESDLKSVIGHHESVGAHFEDDLSRVSYFAQVQATLREMSLIEVARGRDDCAGIGPMEEARAASLLDIIEKRPTPGVSPKNHVSEEPLNIENIRERLPGDTFVISFLVHESGVIAWVIGRDVCRIEKIPLTPDNLKQLVHGMDINRYSLHNFLASSRQLYKLLIRPLIPRVKLNSRLVFVPDGMLCEIPFAALVDPRTGRYLIEDFSLSIAPSVSYYVRARNKVPRRSRGVLDALIVIGDDFNRLFFPELTDLRGVQQEGRAIANLYRQHVILNNEAATRMKFAAAAAESDVIHWAGHALLDKEFPQSSAVLLAPEDRASDPGTLYAFEISRMDLSRVRVVVLAGCSTGRGAYYEGKGVISLARSFMAAGAGSVIATRKDLRDEESLRIMAVFHGAVARGYEPADALRMAQRSFLQERGDGHSSPFPWAVFELIGV